MIYVEIEDIKDNKLVFKGTNKEAIKFLDVSLSTLSNAVSKQRLIRKRYHIVKYEVINNQINKEILKQIFNDYCDGLTLSELNEKYDINNNIIFENLKTLPRFDQYYSHIAIDANLKEQIKQMYSNNNLASLCRELRVTQKQVIAVMEEKPIPLFEKISKGNILKRAFNQSKDPTVVCSRIMNTSRFKLWEEDEDELKRDVYDYYEREIRQFL